MKLLHPHSGNAHVCLRPPRSMRGAAQWGVLGALLIALTLVYGWIWLWRQDGMQQLVGVSTAEIDEELTREITAHPRMAPHAEAGQSPVYS